MPPFTLKFIQQRNTLLRLLGNIFPRHPNLARFEKLMDPPQWTPLEVQLQTS